MIISHESDKNRVIQGTFSFEWSKIVYHCNIQFTMKIHTHEFYLKKKKDLDISNKSQKIESNPGTQNLGLWLRPSNEILTFMSLEGR